MTFRILKTKSIILFPVIFFTSVFAQEARLDMKACLAQAFKNSNLLKIADLSVEMSREDIAAAKAQRVPSLTASGVYTRIGKISSFSIPMGGQVQEFKFGTPNRMNADVSARVPIFTWGRISSTIFISQKANEMSTLQRKQKALEVTDQVLRAYYAVLLNQKVIAVNESNMKRAIHHLHIAEKRFNTGHVSKLQVLRAKVASVNTADAVAETRSNLEKSNIWLAKVIGREGEQITAIGTLDYVPISFDVGALFQQAFAQRHDLAILGLQKEMSRKQISVVGSGSKPTVFASSGYSVQNGFNPMEPEQFVDNWNVGVQISIPLYDGGLTHHQVQKAELQLESAELREKEIRETIAMQIRQAIATLNQAEGKILSQKENINFAKEALQSAEEQYNKGLISSIEVIDAQQNLSQSELVVVQTIFNHIMAKLDLCKAIGNYAWFEILVE